MLKSEREFIESENREKTYAEGEYNDKKDDRDREQRNLVGSYI